MRMSEQRIERIATSIVDRLAEEELVDLTMDEEELAQRIARLIAGDLELEDAIREEASAWLTRNRPHLEPGTSDWVIELERKREEIAIAKAYVLP
jgi:hypothetical protein